MTTSATHSNREPVDYHAGWIGRASPMREIGFQLTVEEGYQRSRSTKAATAKRLLEARFQWRHQMNHFLLRTDRRQGPKRRTCRDPRRGLEIARGL